MRMASYHKREFEGKMIEMDQQTRSVCNWPCALPIAACLPCMHGRFDFSPNVFHSHQMIHRYLRIYDTMQGKSSPTTVWPR